MLVIPRGAVSAVPTAWLRAAETETRPSAVRPTGPETRRSRESPPPRPAPPAWGERQRRLSLPKCKLRGVRGPSHALGGRSRGNGPPHGQPGLQAPSITCKRGWGAGDLPTPHCPLQSQTTPSTAWPLAKDARRSPFSGRVRGDLWGAPVAWGGKGLRCLAASCIEKNFFPLETTGSVFSRRAQFKRRLLREAALAASEKTAPPGLPSPEGAPRPLLSPKSPPYTPRPCPCSSAYCLCPWKPPCES